MIKRFLIVLLRPVTISSAFLLSWIMLQGVHNKYAKVRLGYLFNQLRQCAHENYVDSVRQRYDIHPSVRWGYDTYIYGDGEISIEESSYIGESSYILAHPTGVKLKIGRGCAISHGVHIRTEIHKKATHFRDERESPPRGSDIIIGDYVWIGAHVFIKGGVTIGANSIIGANSVVTNDIPPNTIFGGVPARFIRDKSQYNN
ncbi:MAG: acyltransferase [Caldilineaceae bacterium]